MEKVLKCEKIFEFLEKIKNKGKLIAPVEEDGVILFREIKDIGEINLSYKNSLKPPNEFLFPQNEVLFKFSKEKGEIKLTDLELKENFIIFGIHPCDVRSIKIICLSAHSNLMNSPLLSPLYLLSFQASSFTIFAVQI